MTFADAIPDGMVCQNCHLHLATTKWVGTEGMIAAVHGIFQYWCECCVVTEQIDYARRMQDSIPDLMLKLERACRDTAGDADPA